MTAGFNARKMYSTVEKQVAASILKKIITVPLKMRLSAANFFGNKHTIVKRIAQTVDNCKISRQNEYSIL